MLWGGGGGGGEPGDSLLIQYRCMYTAQNSGIDKKCVNTQSLEIADE